MTANHKTITGPKRLPTRPVPPFCKGKKVRAARQWSPAARNGQTPVVADANTFDRAQHGNRGAGVIMLYRRPPRRTAPRRRGRATPRDCAMRSLVPSPGPSASKARMPASPWLSGRIIKRRICRDDYDQRPEKSSLERRARVPHQGEGRAQVEAFTKCRPGLVPISAEHTPSAATLSAAKPSGRIRRVPPSSSCAVTPRARPG